MTVNKKSNADVTVLELDGRLDTITAPAFQNQLLDAISECDHLELNFARLVYVSSAGLRTLLMGQKTAKAKGCIMEITHVCDEVMEVFEMTGFTDILTIK